VGSTAFRKRVPMRHDDGEAQGGSPITLPHSALGERICEVAGAANIPSVTGKPGRSLRHCEGIVEPFVDPNEVAKYLKIRRRQVLEMTRRGVLPAYPLGSGPNRRVWRYKLSEIDAAVASGANISPRAPIARMPSRVQSHPAVPGANGGNSNG
jgi:excisionase family DNA binding protein